MFFVASLVLYLCWGMKYPLGRKRFYHLIFFTKRLLVKSWRGLYRHATRKGQWGSQPLFGFEPSYKLWRLYYLAASDSCGERLQQLASRYRFLLKYSAGLGNWLCCELTKSRQPCWNNATLNPQNIHRSSHLFISCFVTRLSLLYSSIWRKNSMSSFVNFNIKSIILWRSPCAQRAIDLDIKAGESHFHALGKWPRQKYVITLYANGLEQYQRRRITLTVKKSHRKTFQFAVPPWASAWSSRALNLFRNMTVAKRHARAHYCLKEEAKPRPENDGSAPCFGKKSDSQRNSISFPEKPFWRSAATVAIARAWRCLQRFWVVWRKINFPHSNPELVVKVLKV